VLPAEDIPRLLPLLAGAQARLTAAQTVLAERLAAFLPSQSEAEAFSETTDRWLTTDETADLLKVDRKWLYRRAKGLPFCRRLSRKKLLFSEAGLHRWMANRKP